MTPEEFNAFRGYLGEGSGFQSAMYRHMEFLLGEKSASMLVPHRAVPQVHAELEEALRAPSLYDDVLAHLHRRGYEMPESVLNRDLTQPYRPSPEVEKVWARIYSSRVEHAEAQQLGEVLTDIAEEFNRWRYNHLMATRRAMGAKPGTGGSAGVAWLEKRAQRAVFPELWTARSYV